MPPLSPLTQSPAPAPQKPKGRSWSAMLRRANSLSGVAVLLVTVLAVGGATGYFLAGKKTAAPTKAPVVVQSLSPDEIKKLTEVSSNLGSAGQTLNIGADALFRGKLDVGSDLSVSGRFNANGPVTLSQLNITGTTAVSGLNVGSNMTVTGSTNLQKGLTVNGLLALNGGLNVSGTASVNSLNAASISTRTISISGPLTIGHLVTQGLPPIATAGSALGSGGTVNVNGNDTTGTLNINTAGGTSPGTLANVNFRAAYSGTVHVLLTPLSGAAAATPVYVVRTATGFQIRTDVAAAPGAGLSYDFIVAQ